MEESINYIRSYNKVHPDGETSATHHQPPAPTRRRTIPVVITLTIFTIIIGTIIALSVRQPDRHNNRGYKPLSTEQSVSVINSVCAVTQHPELCLAHVSTVNSSDVVDPMMIFNITLHLAVNEVVNVSLMSKTLIMKVNDLYTGLMFRECVSLFDDAVSRLSRAVEIVNGDGEMMEGRVADLMAWISAAMTDQERCVEGLEEVGSMVGDEVKVRVKRSSVYLSNSLAILANMKGLLDRFGVQLYQDS
ncbi:putative pectinesterase [Helianthus annuus]|uniref:pectinesterase n=1 Tax=Helianthus annuus TaxID=4232 RepID=A0A251U914_HELAN|nr:pectinesterase 1 [Helianthus annuus]KAF5796804.1 putative pectinesterase [Helianthus annuus]KAJ0540078.1 putative pectinesterase [Helianthus annuus]KAJ0548491.1 putative pectinesterase [Helianthus annuus]KAJ0554817.1 putative pectinesterase [Helianthus annuus]KAJ0720384.1 putative pectinesterase [Helianthus annuus]